LREAWRHKLFTVCEYRLKWRSVHIPVFRERAGMLFDALQDFQSVPFGCKSVCTERY
jgi:hypothetical protein